jgi:hypothetical protein
MLKRLQKGQIDEAVRRHPSMCIALGKGLWLRVDNKCLLRSSDGFNAGIRDPFDAPLQLSRVKNAPSAFQRDDDGDFRSADAIGTA